VKARVRVAAAQQEDGTEGRLQHRRDLHRAKRVPEADGRPAANPGDPAPDPGDEAQREEEGASGDVDVEHGPGGSHDRPPTPPTGVPEPPIADAENHNVSTPHKLGYGCINSPRAQQLPPSARLRGPRPEDKHWEVAAEHAGCLYTRSRA